ncbi:MAG: redoxin domain-containing protein [Chloroflexia bacterium]|nr:redoxin domain-containing protein [Chloroflexia bacterium]
MDGLLLIARLLLASVFAVAGVAKLADLAGSRRAMLGFGVPERLAAPLGTALPLAELAVAVALIPTATARWGALGAVALLLIFVGGIGTSLARGRAPDCHCFGQLHSAPAGWSTLVRNGVLAVVALFVMLRGWNDAGPSVVGWLGDLSANETLGVMAAVVVLGLLVGEGWLLLNLLQQNGRLLIRIEALEGQSADIRPSPVNGSTLAAAGLPVGTTAPAFGLPGVDVELLTLDDLRAEGKPVLLVFTDPNCGPCNALLPEIGGWRRDHAARLKVALISRGSSQANRAKSVEHGVAPVLLQQDREVAKSFLAVGTPSAVVVRQDGTIGSPLAGGSEAIRQLVARTVAAPEPIRVAVPQRQAAVPIGQAAPAWTRFGLNGETVDLADYRGNATLVLFWNPGCGFCSRMLPDLKAWDADPPPNAPGLLVVSTGTVEANRAMGLTSPVVLDEGFAIGRSFGAAGTPSAVLVDTEGKVASSVAVGADAVLALAGVQRGQAAPAT